MRSYFLGVDIGTSSVRAVAVDGRGSLASAAQEEYGIITAPGGRVEQDPDAIFRAFLKVIHICAETVGAQGGRIEAGGLSCQMHSLMAVGVDGEPLTPLMTWADTRAGEEAAAVQKIYGAGEIYKRTGCRVRHPMYPLNKVLWLKTNNPDVFFRKAAKFITIKEYIIWKLYGVYQADYTIAASQGYFNIHRQSWDEDIIREIIGACPEKFSEIVECTHIFTGIKNEFAVYLGLSPDTPFIIGSGDGITAHLGCGACAKGGFSSTIGTSGAIRLAVERPLLDDKERIWCYSFTRDIWVVGGAVNNGGIVLNWLKDAFPQQFMDDAKIVEGNIFAVFDKFAAEIPPGSEGLIFLPHLTGERSPDWNADARGIIQGLGIYHSRKHLIRAAMEGIMYRMYDVYRVLAELAGEKDIIANGGYTYSPVWLQMQADIFNRGIFVSGVKEASALGAALLSMVALKKAGDPRGSLPVMQPVETIHPVAEHREIYRVTHEKARDIYERIYGKP
ncbi:MAG: gluconokinase [Bacillota bacterium]